MSVLQTKEFAGKSSREIQSGSDNFQNVHQVSTEGRLSGIVPENDDIRRRLQEWRGNVRNVADAGLCFDNNAWNLPQTLIPSEIFLDN